MSGLNRWLNISKAGQARHDVPYPAPVVELTAPDDGMHMHH